MVEELETTNEEQQASNEELTAANEELQSTNEELQSTNEELHTVNHEYQSKIGELTQLNNDIDNLLKSTEIGVIFLDSQLRIRKFTPAATQAVSLRETDLERPLAELTLKIECPQLPELLKQVLIQHQSIELEVEQKERNSFFLLQINPYQTEDGQNDGLVISFVRIDEIKQVQLELEESLKEKNRQLASIETATNGIAILTEDKFIYLNQAHLDIFGYSKPEELLGKSWRMLYREEDLAQFEQEIFPQLQAQGRWQGIVKAKHRDGYTFDEELTLNYSPQGDLICVCQDISDRLQASDKLRSQKAELSQLNSQLETMVAARTEALARFSAHLKKLHRLAVSEYATLEDLYHDYIKAGCEIFGLSTGIVSQVTDCNYKILAVQSPLEIQVGFETNCRDTYCHEVIDQQKTIAYFDVRNIPEMQNHPIYLQYDLKSFIGTPIFVNGTLYGTLSFSSIPPRGNDFALSEQEIIELMAKDIGHSIAAYQNEIALSKSEAEFRQTFEQATVGITHVSLEGRFVKVNQKLCEILGYSSQELTELTFQEITYPEDLALDEKYVPQIMAGKVENCAYEKRYIRSDGSIVWANLTFCLARSQGGEPSYFIAVIEDISDRKQTEIALLQASQAKDTFIAHMSHELRTPLNSVIGFSNILKSDSQLTAKQLKSIEIINQSGQHLLTLINDVLDLSKLNASKLELTKQDFNLVHFIHDIAAVFQHRAQEKGLNFIVQISPDLPAMVSADETRLRQVLFNLLSNAIKFTDNGSVTLSVSFPTEIEEHQYFRFQIEDTGRGISPDKYQTVFAPFGQINQSNYDVEGTGLGIPICQNVLKLMNSELHLGSKVGQGSLFWFDLNLEVVALPPSSDSIKSTPQRSLMLNRPCKALVVDDNEDNRILLVEYLKSYGFTLEEAVNGQQGLAIAQEFQPDVILVDFLMPVMDGKEMTERIRQHPQLQNTVVLMVSANVQSILNSSDIQCDGFLAKPLDLEQLQRLLAKHLHLDWQILTPEVESTDELIFPPEDELIKLLELVNLGDMETLLDEINSLATRDSQYIPLIKKVRQLAESCQQDRLERLLKTSLQ